MVAGGFNSLTMNLMDEASAGLSAAVGGDYDKELTSARDTMKKKQEQHPWAFAGGELAGAIAPALATGGASAGTSLLGAAGKAAATGAAQSGVAGFGAGEGTEDRLKQAATDAAIGGVAGGILGGVTRGLTKGGKVAAANAARTTPNEFRQASNEAYKAIADSDIVFDPQVMKDAVQNMKINVSANGHFRPDLNKKDKVIANLITQFEDVVDPKSATAITGGQPPASSMMTLDSVERFRQTLKDEYKFGKKAFNAKLKQIENALDAAIATNPEAKQLTDVARAAHRQASQAELLDKVMTKAKDRAGSTFYGSNINNVYRQEFNKILKNDKLRVSFDPPQLDAMKYLVEQDKGANFVRWAGGLSPANGGMMSVLNYGMAQVHPGMMAVTAASALAKRAGNKMTTNLAEGIANQVAGHAPGPISTQASAAAAGPVSALSTMLGGAINGGEQGGGQMPPPQQAQMPPGYVSPLEQMVRQQMGQP
jgi:hypothetical protein